MPEKNETPILSYEQLRDVRDQLKRPLTGRPVLVPFGRKAFFPGTLQDETVTVVVDASGEKLEMPRADALNVLQKEMDGLYKTSKPQKSALKKSAPKPPPEQPPKELSYFEIREELDVAGNEVSSAAINVSKHLEYLRSNPDVVDEDTLPPPRSEPSSEEAEEVVPQDELKKLSDTDYDALSRRLDELAQIEEASESKKMSNTKSSRKLQSKGWSKGFFNKKKSPRTTQPSSNVRKVKFGDSEEKPATKPKPPPPKPIATSVFSGVIQERKPKAKIEVPPDTATANTNRVSFNDSKDEVREIPRVGQTSVSTIQQPSSGRAANLPKTATEQPKKKLSRFAMERQQGLR